EDPILFLIAPLVAEGYSAKMGREFLRALEECIASWGIEVPARAMSFLKSHIHTDGGEAGHWEAVKRSIAGRIKDERTHQRALSLAQALNSTMTAAYESYTDDARIENLLAEKQVLMQAMRTEPQHLDPRH